MQTGFNPSFGAATLSGPSQPMFGKDITRKLVDQEIDLTDGSRGHHDDVLTAMAADDSFTSSFTDPGSSEGGYKAAFERGTDRHEFTLDPGTRVHFAPENEDELVEGPQIKFFKALKEAPGLRWVFGQTN